MFSFLNKDAPETIFVDNLTKNDATNLRLGGWLGWAGLGGWLARLAGWLGWAGWAWLAGIGWLVWAYLGASSLMPCGTRSHGDPLCPGASKGTSAWQADCLAGERAGCLAGWQPGWVAVDWPVGRLWVGFK